MSTQRQETLLPGTDALPRNCADLSTHRGKYLVRVRDAYGYTKQRTFRDPDEAHAFLWHEADALAAQTKNPKENP